jgi:hypothetical protein
MIIPGYSYGSGDLPRSPVSLEQLQDLKRSAGFTDEDERYLRLAGEVLKDQTSQIVAHWRSGNYRRHSEPRAAFPNARWRTDSGIPREE